MIYKIEHKATKTYYVPKCEPYPSDRTGKKI